MTSINTNASALVALETLQNINRNLETVNNQISTGKRINSARDNAAVWAISTVMESDVMGFKTISDSLNLGAASVGVARNAAESVTSLLQDMKALIVSSQEENVDRAKIQTDVDALKGQIDSIVNAAQFNGLNFLKEGGSVDLLSSLDRASDGSVSVANISVNRVSLETTAEVFGAAAASATGALSAASIADATSETYTLASQTVAEGDSFRLDIGGQVIEYVARAEDTSNDVIRNLASRANEANIDGLTVSTTFAADPTTGDAVLTLANSSGAAIAVTVAENSGGTAGGDLGAVSSINVTTDAGAASALTEIETLINRAIDASASFGSAQKRVDIQNDFVSSLIDSLELGVAALTDVNLEEASAELQLLQTQQQLGLQSLSIANRAPQSILALFR
jgi:flagellin